MAKGKKTRRGSSKAGRKRQEGDRLPNGRLAPPGPNERVVAMRREMLGDADLDIATASDPLDFAHAKGFLSLRLYRAALAIGDLYARTRMGAPGMGRGGPEETATTTRAETGETVAANHSRNQWDRMSRKEIAATFDQVFSVTGTPEDAHANAAKAMIRWKSVMTAMTAAERDEVFSVCILRSWPQWVIYRARGKEVPATWDHKRQVLESGLAKSIAAAKLRQEAA